jgi:type I restriction enzyme R subunit
MAHKGGNEPEWLTRKKRIDPKLDALGWKLPAKGTTPLHTPYRSEEYETEKGPADYTLHLDNKVVAVVEAKKLTVGPQNVLTQAERYSKGVTNSSFNFRGYRVPFLYSTNGEVIWFHDIRHPLNRSRKVDDFHTPEALQEMLDQDLDDSCKNLQDIPHHTWLRPYQVEANQAVEQAISERKRAMLLAMATGCGKTYTLVNQVYRLMKAGVAKRVLFLVDRRALAAQAARAFAAFEPEPGLKFDKVYEVYSNRFQKGDFEEGEKFDPKLMPKEYLTNPQAKHAFVYVSTIQRIAINILGRNAIFNVGDETIDEDADKLDIPIHAFDLIVADECHRGYTSSEQSVWRATLNHFDGIKIGLTATPAAHTTSYFRHIAYRYEYQQAVRDGYLVDYDAVNINSNIRMNGVFLDEGEEVEKVDPESGTRQLDLLEDERQFDSKEVESKVTAPDSNRKILEEIKKYADEHLEEYKRFPKTLIFAVNDLAHTSHANQLVDIARDVFGRGDEFVRKITGAKDVDRPLQRIREFRNRPKPGIVVTVDMLSTGVDIPDLEYIVFLRPVKSRILFEQMLGRGTRKGEKHPDKSHFTVFDCFNGTLLEYFKKSTGITAEPPDKPSRSISEVIEDIWNNQDRDYNIRCLVKRLHRIDKQMSGEARDLFEAYIPDGDMAKYARELPEKLKKDFVENMKLLRDQAFQKLLVEYPRKQRVFYVSYDAEDEVSSTMMVRNGGGSVYKPEDYLAAFAQYVKDNQDKIDAIGVLLDRPKDWNTDVLTELRDKLKQSEKHFTEDKLQKVHEAKYHKALVDIISMVKHAADESQPLLTAAERVENAFQKLSKKHQFTADQQAWLHRIRVHLAENLSIDAEDFDDIPIFSREGGLFAARKVFGDQLTTILQELNESIAA